MAHRSAAPDAINLLQELLKAGAIPAEHRLQARHLVARFRREGLAPHLSEAVHRFAVEYRDGDPLGMKAMELLGEMESRTSDGDAEVHVPPPPCDEHRDRLAYGWAPVEAGTVFLCRACWDADGGWDDSSLGVYACSDDCGICEDLVHDQEEE